MVRLSTLVVLACLAGCSDAHHAQDLCESYVKQQLINPETAQFFEFKEVSEQAWLDQSMSHWNYTGAERQQAIRNLEQMWDEGARKGIKAYSLRYKAQGRLGNLITSFSLCTANKDACVCGTDDEGVEALSRS